MSSNKVTALIIVALLHVALGYALVTGLAYEAAKKAIERVTTVDIKEPEKPKDEPPPPPPKQKEAPPPPVAPPVKINVAPTPPQITTVSTPPPAPPPVIQLPTAPVAPPAPAPKGPSSPAQPRGNPGGWATDADYPSRALREEKQGTTSFRLSVGPDGRVTDCQVTGSSGSDELDQTTCTLVTRRARFKPAMQDGQPVASTYSNRIRWVIPK